MTAFLQIQRLRKTYDDVVAIDQVSLDVRKGEFMTFLGPSGSGKSTTLYIVAGFQEPSEGRVLLDGKPLLSVAPNKRNIGMVFQRYTLFPHLTVGENIAFPLRVRRLPDAEVKAKVEQMLKLVHLSECRDRMPAQLSGGQQQRVAIARALAYDPPVLLMDEPLSALDKKLREEIQLELRRIHQETGVTILCDARSGRGTAPVGPDCRVQQGAYRTGRHGRGTLFEPGVAFRRELYRQFEFPAGARDVAQRWPHERRVSERP
jgi:putative spermidine/putrescine transport system ATP-binding protein